MTKPPELLPCPFCGPMNGHYGFTIGRFGTRLTCFCCDSHGPRAATQEEAIAAWNTRTQDPLPARGVRVPKERPDAPAHIVEYTNWRGETARRTIIPIRMWWGSTEWHPQEQWMLTAWDLDKDAARDFAWQDMRPVQNGATSAAVAAQRTPDPAVQALVDALRFGVDLIKGDSIGSEWKRGQADFRRKARAALAAFDKTD